MKDKRSLMTDYEKFISELELPPTQTDSPSVYAFSLHKSGSTLLFDMLTELAPHVGYTYFSLPNKLFSNGINPKAPLPGATKFFEDKGYVYGGFRNYPDSRSYVLPELSEFKKILLVRNPLDTLVSMYFSERKSHVIPKVGEYREIMLKQRESALNMTLDEFVRERYKSWITAIKSYVRILDQENLYIFRYEDIIYEKKTFLIDICRIFGWKADSNEIDRIASKYDVFPDKENEDQHIRQVHPGNHKKHLTDETRYFLEMKFSDVLEAFGYKVSPRLAHIRLTK